MPRVLYRLLQSRNAKARSLRQYLWNYRAMGARRRNTYLVEQLENRFLLSAEAAPLALSADLLNETLVVEQLVDAGLAEASNSQKLELVRQHEDTGASADNDTVTERVAKEAENSDVSLDVADTTIESAVDVQTLAEVG